MTFATGESVFVCAKLSLIVQAQDGKSLATRARSHVRLCSVALRKGQVILSANENSDGSRGFSRNPPKGSTPALGNLKGTQYITWRVVAFNAKLCAEVNNVRISLPIKTHTVSTGSHRADRLRTSGVRDLAGSRSAHRPGRVTGQDHLVARKFLSIG